MLPINRKERYYTGTVLPAIACCDGFAHIDRLFDLFGVTLAPGWTRLDFLTEYGLKESLAPVADGFALFDGGRDTPDVVVAVDGDPASLLVIEAKMYDTPSPYALERQLQAQKQATSFMADLLNTENAVQGLLLPASLAISVASVPVVTWEALAGQFRDVAPAYWINVLERAIEKETWTKLRSQVRANDEDRLSGAEILAGVLDGSLPYGYIGRRRGLTGFEADVADGSWSARLYQCRADALPDNPNWFSVADLAEKAGAAAQ